MGSVCGFRRAMWLLHVEALMLEPEEAAELVLQQLGLIARVAGGVSGGAARALLLPSEAGRMAKDSLLGSWAKRSL